MHDDKVQAYMNSVVVKPLISCHQQGWANTRTTERCPHKGWGRQICIPLAIMNICGIRQSSFGCQKRCTEMRRTWMESSWVMLGETGTGIYIHVYKTQLLPEEVGRTYLATPTYLAAVASAYITIINKTQIFKVTSSGVQGWTPNWF